MHQNNHKDLILLTLLKTLLVHFLNKRLLFHCQWRTIFRCNFKYSFSELFNKFTNFLVPMFYMMVTEFFENLRVVFFRFFNDEKHYCSIFLVFKFSMKLICCGFFKLVCLLKPITSCVIIIFAHINNFFVGFFFLFYWQVKETFSINDDIKISVSAFGT